MPTPTAPTIALPPGVLIALIGPALSIISFVQQLVLAEMAGTPLSKDDFMARVKILWDTVFALPATILGLILPGPWGQMGWDVVGPDIALIFDIWAQFVAMGKTPVPAQLTEHLASLKK